MKHIVFISTIHKETGKCNADELFLIIEKIRPEVIFVEATKDTYTKYEKSIFETFKVPHKKSEIKAIQKYSITNLFKYIPVLDHEAPKSFIDKFDALSQNIDISNMYNYFHNLICENGYEYLNSKEADMMREKIVEFEKLHFTDMHINKAFDEGNDKYENNMLSNIFAYCNSNQFETAIFMCGDGHRKSIIEKVQKKILEEGIDLKWQNYGN